MNTEPRNLVGSANLYPLPDRTDPGNLSFTGNTQIVAITAHFRVEKERTWSIKCQACGLACDRTTFFNRPPKYGNDCNGISKNCRKPATNEKDA